MKNLLAIFALVVLFTSCSKEFEQRNIVYRFEQGPKKGIISYLVQDSLYTDSFNLATVPLKLWQNIHKGTQGDRVYMFLKVPANEAVTAMMKFKASIIIDGKTYMQSTSFNTNDKIITPVDTTYYIRLYGTVPF